MQELKINRKRTVSYMKQEMEQLSHYCATLRLQSVLYGEDHTVLQVEDDITDYLHYSRSVVHIPRKPLKSLNEPVLEAILRKQRHSEIIQQRDANAYILLEGIVQLQDSQRQLLLDVYVRQLSRTQIMQQAGGIVESTYHRRLQKALIELAILLHREIYE